jgi:hypothetical protein
VPTTFEEAFFGPKKIVWRPEIYEELISFISRKAFKERDKKQVIEQLRRKLMITKWIFKRKSMQTEPSSTRQDAYQEDSCKYLELIIQSHLHQ